MWKIIQILSILFAVKSGLAQTIIPTSTVNVEDCSPASPTVILSVSIGPCFDTLGCKMPDCCGIITGQLTNFSFTYNASIEMSAGSNHGLLSGVEIGSSNDPLVALPTLIVQVPNAVVSYDYDACHYTSCPQVVGQVYRWDGLFTVPLTAVSTFTLIANFFSQVTSNVAGNPICFCKKLNARLINKNFLPSLLAILDNPPFSSLG